MDKVRITHPPDHWPPLLPRYHPASRAGLVWRVGSSFIIPTVAVLSKIWAQMFNRTKVYNHQVFLQTLNQHYRYRKYPLITISNHSSCLDDPLLWGALFPWTWTLNSFRHRWSAAAYDICFTKKWHSLFFILGRSLPVCRGAGIYQPALVTILDLLRERQFLHVFPQARVCEEVNGISDLVRQVQSNRLTLNELCLNDKEDLDKPYALKWGLARLIMESLNDHHCDLIQVLPFYHVGMEQVLPNQTPYIPRSGHQITIVVRQEGAIDFTRDLLRSIYTNSQTESERRSLVMQFLEQEMKKVKYEALRRHVL